MFSVQLMNWFFENTVLTKINFGLCGIVEPLFSCLTVPATFIWNLRDGNESKFRNPLPFNYVQTALRD